MTNTVDQLEKIGRFVLWISIAVVFALVPIGLYGRDKQAAKDVEQARADRAREKAELMKEKAADDEEKKPKRLALASLGEYLSALDGSAGLLWFSNPSSEEGVVCVKGVATGGGRSTESLASCKKIGAYETNVKMSVIFAGGEIKTMCPNPSAPCQFSVKEVPAHEPARVAAAGINVPPAPGH